MSEVDIASGSAGQLLASYIDRILRLREEADERMQDVSEVLKEAKDNGFDRGPIKALVAEIRKRAKKGEAADEADALLELYREAYHRAASCVHTREAA